MFARIFACWHPAHTTSPTTCCSRPTSAFGKYLQGLHFFGRPAADPQEFVAAVNWWLSGTLKLGLVPALWLLIPEVFMRFTWISIYQRLSTHFPGHGSLGNSLAIPSGTGRRTPTLHSSLSLATALQRQRTTVSKMLFKKEDGFIWSLVAYSVASSHGRSSLRNYSRMVRITGHTSILQRAQSGRILETVLVFKLLDVLSSPVQGFW